MSMALILVAMVVSLGPLFNLTARVQRDLDHATRAAAVQVDLQELESGLIVFNENKVREAFLAHFDQHELVSAPELFLDLDAHFVTSKVWVRIRFRPLFYKGLTFERAWTSTVQIFFADPWQD